MSTTIDQNVVEMRFDNKHFENNVQTTMSTLDKLKQKLHLNGASKGLEDINTAAKKVDMSGLGKGVEAVQAKFSALQVMGVTALANITNSAVNAGKKMVSALTIDPIKTGFQEYETQMGAVQTILANTKSKGSTLDDVNKALDTLNTYADKTIYNFTEMTKNIGTFTAAGVDLQTSVDSIQGIANLAAVSGSTSQQASTAMYQLSQALAAGRVSLMDWNSVVNAGMGGELFQNALIRTSELLDTGAKKAIETHGSFRESLTKGEWLTTEVLTETLKQISGAYTDAELLAQGYTNEQVKEIQELAQTATSAATEVKTFTQLWDVMKESAQSGWAQTWKLIIGDFEEAKALLTPLADFFTGVIGKMSDARNKLLESALGRSFGDLSKKINSVLEPMKGTAKSIEKVTDSVKDYSKVVDEIIGGDWGDGQARWDKLTEAGYDWAHAQNLVNEKLGDGTRHASKYTEAQKSVNEAQDKGKKTQVELSKNEAKRIEQLANMSDAQLKNLGYTNEQIEAFRELKETSDKLGLPLSEFIEKIDEINGRWLLIESFKNVGDGLIDTFNAIKKAWQDIFPPKTVEEKAEGLFNIIAALHKFTRGIKDAIYVDGEFTEKGENLIRTLKGIFAIIDIVTTIAGGAFKIAFKVLTAILGYFDMDILDLTAKIGDVIVKFRDWLDSTLDFTKVIEFVAPYVKKAAEAIGEWIDKLKESKIIKDFTSYLSGASEGIKEWFAGLKETDNIPKYIIQGLVKGLYNGVKTVGEAVWELGKAIIQKICDVLGIHSPSKEFEKVGRYTIEGFIQGIKNGASGAWEAIKGFGKKCIDIIKNIDFGALLAAGIGVGLLAVAKNFTDIIEKFAAPFEGLGNLFDGIGSFFESLGNGIEKNLKASALKKKSRALLNMAIAIGILAASVYLLSKLDAGKLWVTIGALAALAAIVIALSIAAEKFGKVGDSFGKNSGSILAISGSLLILAIAMKQLASIDGSDVPTVIATLAAMIVGLAALMIAFGKFVNPKTEVDMKQAGVMLMKMSIALLVMTSVIKKVSKLDDSAIEKGMGVIIKLELLFMAVMYVSKFAGENASKAGTMLLLMSGAFIIMTSVIKRVSKMSAHDIEKGLRAIMALGGIFSALIMVSKFAGQNASKAGFMLISMSVALAITVSIIKQISDLKDDEIKRGLGVIAMVELLFAAVIATSHFAGENAVKAGTMLLLMSGALAILAGVMFILGQFNPDDLARSLAAVSVLMLIFGGLVAVTKVANDTKGMKNTLITLVVAIGILTVAIAALSFIDPAKLAIATTALSSVIGIFALLIASTKYAKNTKPMRKSLLQMLGVVVVLALVVAALSQLDPNSVLTTTASLSILMLSFATALTIMGKAGRISTTVSKLIFPMLAVVAGLALIIGLMSVFDVSGSIETALSLGILLNAMATAMVILSKTGKTSMSAVGALAVMGLVVGELALILGLMSYFNVGVSLETVASISLLLFAMTGVLAILSLIGPMASSAFAGIGALALMGLVVGELAIILGLMSHFDVTPSLETAASLSLLLVSMSGALILLGVVGLLGPAAFIGIAALVTLIAGIGGLVVAIGALMTEFPALESFLDAGIPVLEKIGYALGSFFGNIVGGFLGNVTSGLPDMANDLSLFMENLKPFIDGAKNIDASAMEGIKSIAETILILTAADILEGLTSWLTGGSSLESFGAQLGGLGTNINQFATNLGTFDESRLNTVMCAAKAIKALAQAAETIPNEGGLWAAIVGDNSLASFGAQLGGLGTNLNTFVTNLGTFDEAKLTTVKCAANAVKVLAEAASTIPNEGGLWAAIVGDNSLASFGAQLGGLGTNLNTFATNLGTFDEAKVATVKCAADAIKTLAEAADSIPNEGGMWAAIVGDNSVATFGDKLPELGTNLKGFATNLGELDEATIATVSCAADAIAAMAKAAESIDGQADWAKKLFGDNSLSAFGEELESVGSNLKNFASNLGTFGEDKLATVEVAVKAIKAFAKLADADLKGAKKHMSGFGEEMVSFASDISSFCNKLPSGETMTTAVDNIKSLLDAIDSVSNANSDSISEFSDSLKDLGDSGVDGFVSAFNSSATKKEIRDAASTLVDKFVDGVDKDIDDVETSFKDGAEDAASAAKKKQQKFYNAGSHLVTGFANGISENTYKATAKARAMAKAAAQAAKDELDINSPSKVFRRIGMSIPEGFALGIDKLSNVVSDSSIAMARTAINSARGSLSRIADVINSDVDAQPTIRPVLDLSDVKAGANAIGSMLTGRTLSVNTEMAGVVSASMLDLQNGSDSSDIVSAIKGLRKDIADMPRNTYSISGITYDDGTNISNAVGDLVRAAKIERRI